MKQLFLFILILISATFVIAQTDDAGNPNDPNLNERANACYDGSTMESKCDTEWEWICGWYIIRFDSGIISRAEFPAACASLLPPLPTPEAAVAAGYVYPTAGCIIHITGIPNIYVNFAGGNFLAAPVDFYYDDPTCATPIVTSPNPLAYAPNGQADATAICIREGFTGAIKYPNSPLFDTYICT